MTDSALIRTLERDLPRLHRQRMADRQAEQMAELRAERSKPQPDLSLIDAIKTAMVQTERDKLDVSITEREVLKPLREGEQRERDQAEGKKSTAAGE